MQLRAGSTVLSHHTPNSNAANTSNNQLGLQWIVQALDVPGAAANVECTMLANSNQIGSVAVESDTDMPVALATNGALTLQVATQWATARTGANTLRLSQFIVEALN